MSDLTLNPVSNDIYPLNYYNFDISSIAIDPHDPTGNTVYAAVSAISTIYEVVQTIYRSTNGGASWSAITANLPNSPVNAVAIDPQSASTVYVATDSGVYYTTEVTACATPLSYCWSAFGTGLPEAPVVTLSAASATASAQVLVAGTYGRGIWQTGLWSAGTSLASASLNPAAMVFQSQTVGATGAAQTVTILNTGSIALQPSSIAFAGDPDDFTASGSCIGRSIPSGGNCSLQVTFTPQAAGQRTAQMIVYANVYGGQLSVDLDGTGLAAGNVVPGPPSLAFGLVEVGSTATALPVTLTNSGAAATSISSITVTAPFTLPSDSCGTSLGANSACNVEVGFKPAQSGAYTGTLTFVDGAGTQSVQLTGTGAAPPTDTLSSTSLSFPATASGQISAAQAITITNSGDLPLQVTSVAAGANFQQSSSCISGVAAHSVCSINVEFAPTQVGLLTGTLTLTDAIGVERVSLSGTGLTPASLTVYPTSLTFPPQQAGVPGQFQTLTITNSGGAALANIGFQFTGAAASGYSVQYTNCGALLSSGGQCTAQIVFTASATGTIAAALSVSSSTPGSVPASVPLNGTGTLATAFQTNPAQIPFSTVIPVGQSSSAQTVTITNTSNYTIGSVSLATTAPFALKQNTCTGGLGAGANCSAAVSFAPSSSGTATGTLTVSSAVVAQSASVSLSGTGFSFTVESSGPTSQTVTSGQQADYKILISPSGAPATFDFQCGALPANAECVFNPTTESLVSGVQGDLEVQIYTGNSSQSLRNQPDAPLGSHRAAPLFCILLLPLAFLRRRRLFLMVLLAVVFSGGVSSCTSSMGGTSSQSNSSSGGSTTPAGTYSVPLTVSAMGLSQSVTLTLVVD